MFLKARDLFNKLVTPTLSKRNGFVWFSSVSNQPIRIANLLKKQPVGTNLTVKGWVKSIRKMSKKLIFVDLCDGSSVRPLQVIFFNKKLPDNLSFHSSIEVNGNLQQSKTAGQEIELLVNNCSVIGVADPLTYSFDSIKDHMTDMDQRMRQYPHIRQRHKKFASMLRVRSQMKSSIYEYFNRNGFVNIDTPIITTNNCEGGANVFQIKPINEDVKESDEKHFFPKSAYLTVSGQLHLEAAASGLSKVFNFSPTFRAESSFSRRHLAEFWMIEAEEAFLQNEKGESDLIDRIKNMIQYSLKNTLNIMEEEVSLHWKQNNQQEIVQTVLDNKYEQLTYNDAIKILEQNKSKIQKLPCWGKSLYREHELFLTKHLGNRPLFITRWPRETKSFYACQTEDENLVYGVELLIPEIGELAGGSLREYRIDILQNNLKDQHALEWYLDLRRWGMTPTGGFGIGFERLLVLLLGIENVKDVILFPRWKYNCFG